MSVYVQTEDFDTGFMLNQMRLAHPEAGALVSFIGQVREFTKNAQHHHSSKNTSIHTLTLEHYPGMTEHSLALIEVEAHARWDLIDTLIIHRVGSLKPCDQIVLVAVLSAHRGEAFKACEFIMDYLKTQAPFWKKEANAAGEYWVDAKSSDDDELAKWNK